MFTINADRPALEIERGGQKFRWEYDIVTLKLELERLDERHRSAGGTPTTEYLQDFAQVLQSHGLEGCTPDIALRMQSLVRVQFAQLSSSIYAQLPQVAMPRPPRKPWWRFW